MSFYKAVLVNLLSPGAGIALYGNYLLDLKYQIIFLAFLSLILSRGLLLAGWPAVYIALGCYVLFFALSSFKCHQQSKKPDTQRKSIFIGLAFVLFSYLLLLLIFIQKDTWLGVQVYFVPSPSMQPTLNPGDFILADTWAFTNRSPNVGEIVIVEQSEKFFIVKRCAAWPNSEQCIQDGEAYLLGDNANSSLDSRKLGGISITKLRAKAILVLAHWEPSTQQTNWMLGVIE